jgi:hypothetical protein
MQFDSESKKKPYSAPRVTKLTPERAKQFVADHTNCSDQEATDWLESLRKEQQQREKQSVRSAQESPRTDEKMKHSA